VIDVTDLNDLARVLVQSAVNNAASNHRLHAACVALDDAATPRTSTVGHRFSARSTRTSIYARFLAAIDNADAREGGQRMALATAVTNARSTRCASGSCPRRQDAADL
jgi:hypothetical protein